MYIDYRSWESFEYKISTLKLDVNNPRIRFKERNLNQTEIIKYLVKFEKVYELAKKISEEGYFIGEEPIICLENNKKIVLEGNRRTAALKLLQDPNKFLSRSKANVLLQNILKNDFPVDQKLRCYIAPNRLLANPIIYERHNGVSLHKWKTGNQYSFVAEMFYEDGLNIEEIAEVLNEKRSNIIKPLKAYNLFYEGKEILEKEKDVHIDITSFDITNLERFYAFSPARKLMGIEFLNNTGELIINIPREEFEKRITVIFEMLIDAERFSRDFNNESDKERFVENLKQHPNFDKDIDEVKEKPKSITSEQKKTLEEKKSITQTRRRKPSKKGKYENFIIPRDTQIFFESEKLNILFTELKNLPIDRVYSFSLLLRSYLEQSLYFYITEKAIEKDVSKHANKQTEKNGARKVEVLISHLRGSYSISKEIDPKPIMKILKFEASKDYSNTTLKSMLDYVVKNEVINHLDSQKYKNLKDYIERIKSGLDLAVHNIETIVDLHHNKRAWKALEPLFQILSNDLNTD